MESRALVENEFLTSIGCSSFDEFTVASVVVIFGGSITQCSLYVVAPFRPHFSCSCSVSSKYLMNSEQSCCRPASNQGGLAAFKKSDGE